MPKLTEIEIGTRYGKLTTVSATFPVRGRGGTKAHVGVQCDCGGSSIVKVDNLKRGRTTTCGCGRATSRYRRAGFSDDGDCGHPNCTRVHDTNASDDTCPATRERGNRLDRANYQRRKRNRYVYAVILNETTLKIGCSTQPYGRQAAKTGREFKARGFGPATGFTMVWHRVGDVYLETFLQWRASRIWKPLAKGNRHSEWFDVTGVSQQDVIKHLRRWYTQIEKLDEWDAEQERLVP